MSDQLAETYDPLGLVDGLLEKYAPKNDTLDVVLPLGEVLKFRVMRDTGELDAIKTGGLAFVKLCEDKGRVPDTWREFLPLPATRLMQVYALADMSIEPKFTQLDMLKLAKRHCWLFDSIYSEVSTGQYQSLEFSALEKVEESKNESSGTHSGESD